jgi:hypothetical protein
MARNVIAELLLAVPREQRADTGACRDVPRGPEAGRAHGSADTPARDAGR